MSLKLPYMYMMCGLPASGKSSYAKMIHESTGAVIHSSDSLRKEIFGDENNQTRQSELFSKLHRRVKDDLLAGKSVIYDATNINKKRRIAFLKYLEAVPCVKICIVIATNYAMCLSNSQTRSCQVPETAIRRMYMSWQPPHISEGWDDIKIYRYNSDFIQFDKSFYGSYDQCNSHHSFSLGEHMELCAKYVRSTMPNDNNLWIAALVHDIGKPFTKTFTDRSGLLCNEAHYYQHQCVGAYDVAFLEGFADYANSEDVLDVSNLVYYHMHPYMSWTSPKSRNRDRNLLGDSLFERIQLLHKCDMATH